MESVHWPEFLKSVLEEAPDPKSHEGVRAQIHPNEVGKWVWHASIDLNENLDQKQWLTELLKPVGEGEPNFYVGGIIKRVLHIRKALTPHEVNQLPSDAVKYVEDHFGQPN